MVERFKGGQRLSETLVGVQAGQKELPYYLPELHLSEWFRRERSEDVTIWCFAKTGANPLLRNYQLLVERLGIDGILLIDGGVDSLIRGDEAQTGTMVEDVVSLCAVNQLNGIPTKLIACVGFGVERDLTYTHILANIAALAREGGFLGTCSLTNRMAEYAPYESACRHAWDQPAQTHSIINASIISAVIGEYGNFHLTPGTAGSRLWISPLMPIYWFFDFQAVAERHEYLGLYCQTESFGDAFSVTMHARASLRIRPASRIPLT